MSHEGVNVVDVGRRLRIAREAAGMTQAHAAANIKVARTTLVAMEKGQRAVRFAELRPLARLYGTSVNALLRRESVYTDLVPRFRKLPGSQDESSAEAPGCWQTSFEPKWNSKTFSGSRIRETILRNGCCCPGTCAPRPKMTRRNFGRDSGWDWRRSET